MRVKIHNFAGDGQKVAVYAFHCVGCGYDHAFTVGEPQGDRPRWTFNGSLEAPTFHPSLLCNKDTPELRCHSFVEDGKIIYLADCHHKLAGQTVQIPDWNSE